MPYSVLPPHTPYLNMPVVFPPRTTTGLFLSNICTCKFNARRRAGVCWSTWGGGKSIGSRKAAQREKISYLQFGGHRASDIGREAMRPVFFINASAVLKLKLMGSFEDSFK
jgi:hypothetical protein